MAERQNTIHERLPSATDVSAAAVIRGRFDAVLLDLDGTLVDSAPDLHAAANEVLVAHGRARLSLDSVRRFVGDGIGQLIQRSLAHTGQPIAPEALPAAEALFLKRYMDPDIPHLTRTYAGVHETLGALHRIGLRLAVCTNKRDAAARAVLEQAGIAEHVDAVIGADSAGRQKPDPAHLRAALAALGARPERAVMVGDGPNDAAAAHAVPLPVILVGYGYSARPRAELGAAAVIGDFAELPAALAALAASPPAARPV